MSAVLGEPTPPTSVNLLAHPRAARRRRLIRAIASAMLPVMGLGGAGLWYEPLLPWVIVGAAVMLPLALLLAHTAYRNLAHGYAGEYLVTRYGTAKRHTVALQRRGVVGWKITQSYFQRRAGLASFGVITAAGKGVYWVHDADASEGLEFAGAAVPSLLAQAIVTRRRP